MKCRRFGALLVLHRLSHGTTQRKLAEKSGIDLKAWQHAESAQNEPLASTAWKLEHATGLKFTPADYETWVDKSAFLKTMGYEADE